MSKVYTVKSNARRDAKKLGLPVESVVEVDGGWSIAEPKADAGEKRATLARALGAGWTPIDSMMKELGWQAHSVRGAISTLGKHRKVERRREDGVTSYRFADA